jgi:hypothetical protein
MVALYVNGTKVGTLDENPDVLKQLVESGQLVEFRTIDGKTLGEYTPRQPALVPWNPSITKDELDRRAAGPGGMTLGEFWKQMGAR